MMILKVTNSGSTPQAVEAFANPNFHLGTGTGDTVGAENESISVSGGKAIESGPGGGAMIYQPLGGFDKADCSGTGYTRVMNGMDLLGSPQSCSNQNDLTLVFQKSLGTLAPGASALFGLAIQFSADAASAETQAGALATWLAGRTPQKVLDDALAEWEAWRKPPPSGLSSDERAVWRQSEAVLRMAQVLEPWQEVPKQKGYGMILASLPPGVWHIGWVRDAMYAIVALARMGHHAEARRALGFYLDAEANRYQSYAGAPYRISVTRYFGDGQEESDWNADGPNIEFDGWGLYLWASRAYLDASGDLAWLSSKTRAGETVLEVLRDQIAAPLDRNREPSNVIVKDCSIWESHWDKRKHYAYTSLAAARGLCDFSSLAARAGDSQAAAKYRAAAEAIRGGARASFVDPQLYLAGSLEGLAGGKYHDAAVLEAFNWSLYPTSDAIWQATLDGISKLEVPSGGYMRNDDALSSYDSNEWVVIDLRAASALRRFGRTARADSLVAWTTAQARANQDLHAELYNQFASDGTINGYAGATPMVGFGAAAYVLALLDRAGAAVEQTSCDATASDGGIPDGGMSDGAMLDGGVAKPRDGGCSCNTGNREVASGWIWGALLLFILRRARASRARDRAAG
jgi:GH15 family glucan-1,4-alpha-glucosidase